MTERFELKIMGTEHAMKQPPDQRYALYCKDAFLTPRDTDCDAKESMGWMGDFSEYSGAKDGAIQHEHDGMIRFYPNTDNPVPSPDFLDDFQRKTNHGFGSH